MKRTIEVRAGDIRITATIDSKRHGLGRDEVEHVRDRLADRLLDAAAELPYSFRVPRHKVRVR